MSTFYFLYHFHISPYQPSFPRTTCHTLSSPLFTFTHHKIFTSLFSRLPSFQRTDKYWLIRALGRKPNIKHVRIFFSFSFYSSPFSSNSVQLFAITITRTNIGSSYLPVESLLICPAVKSRCAKFSRWPAGSTSVESMACWFIAASPSSTLVSDEPQNSLWVLPRASFFLLWVVSVLEVTERGYVECPLLLNIPHNSRENLLRKITDSRYCSGVRTSFCPSSPDVSAIHSPSDLLGFGVAWIIPRTMDHSGAWETALGNSLV